MDQLQENPDTDNTLYVPKTRPLPGSWDGVRIHTTGVAERPNNPAEHIDLVDINETFEE